MHLVFSRYILRADRARPLYRSSSLCQLRLGCRQDTRPLAPRFSFIRGTLQHRSGCVLPFSPNRRPVYSLAGNVTYLPTVRFSIEPAYAAISLPSFRCLAF